MRKPVVLGALVALFGGVLGAVGVLASHWWSLRNDGSVVEYGGSYVPLPGIELSAPRPDVDYLPTDATQSTDWVGLLWPAIAGGAVGAVLLAGVAWLVHRRVRPR